MNDLTESNLAKFRFHSRQEFFWSDTALFFEWCGSRLKACVESLDGAQHAELASGKIPEKAISRARAEISETLTTQLPLCERVEVVQKTLTGVDLSRWMNTPIASLDRLPKRIRDAVADAEETRRGELHARFFGHIGDAEMADYIRVWRSQDFAHCILIALARREITFDELDQKANEAGTVSFGGLRLNDKRYVLRHVETTGGLRGRAIAEMIFRLAQRADSDFFIALGKALEKRARDKNVEPEVEWCKVNVLAQLLAGAWCSSPANTKRPPLCLFETKALATFCALALGRKKSDPTTSDKAVRKWISRLRLRRAEKPKVREVKVTGDEVLFVGV
jgi:hypothetical protein